MGERSLHFLTPQEEKIIHEKDTALLYCSVKVDVPNAKRGTVIGENLSMPMDVRMQQIQWNKHKKMITANN